jgi:hypothetical protein
MDRPNASPLQTYEIIVRSDLGERWSTLLAGLGQAVEVRGGGPEETDLVVDVRDQAALRGLLNQLWDLNLTLVSLRRILPHPKEAER